MVAKGGCVKKLKKASPSKWIKAMPDRIAILDHVWRGLPDGELRSNILGMLRRAPASAFYRANPNGIIDDPSELEVEMAIVLGRREGAL